MRASSLVFGLVSALAATGAFAQARLGPPGEENPVVHQPTSLGARLGDSPRMIVKFRSTGASDRAQIQAAESDAPTQTAAAAPGSVVAKFAGRSGLAVQEVRALMAGMHLLHVDPRAGESFEQQLERVRSDPDVEFAVPDERRYAHAVPNDPLYATQQWYLQNGAYTGAGADPTVATQPSAIHAQSAWDLGVGTSNVVIAVIDTGVLFSHPDLGTRLLPGYDFISDKDVANDNDGRDPDATDAGDWITAAENSAQNGKFTGCAKPNTQENSSWHGTRVSGIIGALSNNGTGVAGITWNTRILPARALGKCGGFDSDIIDAMAWAAGLHVANVPDNPASTWAKIENLSLGSVEACPASYQSIVSTLNSMGVAVVASAGNENGPVDTPANCPGVIAVAGLRHTGTKVGFSSLGPEVTVGAPGGNCVNVTGGPCLFSIGTTTNDGLTTAGNNIYTDQINNINVGTSFSAPIVSGILGLMASANSHLTPAQLAARLQKGATPYPVSSDPNAPPMCPTTNANSECTCTTSTCGAGMANAEGALKEALRPIAVLTAPSPVSSGQNVTLSGVGSVAADGHTIATYLWQVVTGTASLTSTDQITTSLVAPDSGTTDVRFTVTDDAGRQDSLDWIFQAVTVTVTPTSASVQAAGGTQTFIGTAQNAANAGVTWAVNGVSGGNAIVGTISAFGVYTAPTTVPSPAIVTVTAASIQDPSRTASAQVTITAPPTPTTPPASTGGSSGGGGGGGALDLLGLLALVTIGRRLAPRWLRAPRVS